MRRKLQPSQSTRARPTISAPPAAREPSRLIRKNISRTPGKACPDTVTKAHRPKPRLKSGSSDKIGTDEAEGGSNGYYNNAGTKKENKSPHRRYDLRDLRH